MLKLGFNKGDATLYQLIAGLTALTFIIIGCIVVLTPFFPAMLLATIFTLATWPAFVWLRARLKRGVAFTALLMSLLLALCFIVPLVMIGTSVAENFSSVYGKVQEALQGDPAQAAAHLRAVPVAGEYLEKLWTTTVSDREAFGARLKEYSGTATTAVLKIGRAIGYGLFDVTLGVIISYFLFRHGAIAAGRIAALVDKFGGPYGHRLLDVCKTTLIGVVYGLLGTALAQGALAVFGFWLAGVPGATFLGFLTFCLSLIPAAPPLVWGPAALWLYSEGQTGWAVFLVLWGITVISSIDNVLKPYFISRGSNLPLLLVLLGIMGGVVAFGFIGVFLGPVLLALAYALLLEWSTVRREASEGEGA